MRLLYWGMVVLCYHGNQATSEWHYSGGVDMCHEERKLISSFSSCAWGTLGWLKVSFGIHAQGIVSSVIVQYYFYTPSETRYSMCIFWDVPFVLVRPLPRCHAAPTAFGLLLQAPPLLLSHIETRYHHNIMTWRQTSVILLYRTVSYTKEPTYNLWPMTYCYIVLSRFLSLVELSLVLFIIFLLFIHPSCNRQQLLFPSGLL